MRKFDSAVIEVGQRQRIRRSKKNVEAVAIYFHFVLLALSGRKQFSRGSLPAQCQRSRLLGKILS